MSAARPSTSTRQSRSEADPRRSLGLRIKELRAEYGLTQEELAERSGLFRTYMSRIESGSANPTLTMLYQISSAFAVDVRELLSPPAGPIPPRVIAAERVSRGRVTR